MQDAIEVSVSPLRYTPEGVYALADGDVVRKEASITGDRLYLVQSFSDLPGRPGKIMCTGNTEHFSALRNRWDRELSISSSNERLLEISPKGISKQTAAAFIAGKFGMGPDSCVAAGDAENDLAMLQWAGCAITVRSAIDEVKNLADFVGPSCDEGGIADALAWLSRRRQGGAGGGFRRVL